MFLYIGFLAHLKAIVKSKMKWFLSDVLFVDFLVDGCRFGFGC